jgi:fused signal recognition particle receptor
MSWFSKLKQGLSKTSNKIITGLDDFFNKTKLDKDSAQNLEDILISTDMGLANAHKIVSELVDKHKFDKDTSIEDIKSSLAEIISKLFKPIHQQKLHLQTKPQIIMVCGVNGNGKTTSIAKLANLYKSQGHKIMLAACDTFRAAAVEQLAVWAERLGIEIITGETNSDPASIVYKAIKTAIETQVDILFIDTAGRLHNKNQLMDELAKIMRVAQKIDANLPIETLLVLDATTGQNALVQLEKFNEVAKVTGIIMTKLDGTAKGGIIVSLAQKYDIPIIALGVGEGIEDMKSFDPNEFAKALVGL